jgi:hypothetical protein
MCNNMKQVVFTVLVIAVMSCGTHPQSYVEVREHGDSVQRGYIILSATDSTVTLQKNYPGSSADIAPRTVPFSNIDHIYSQGDVFTGSAVGGATGLGVGFSAGILLFRPKPEKSDPGSLDIINPDGIVAAIEIMALSEVTTIAGGIIGCRIADRMQEIDLGTRSSVKRLQQRSVEASRD